MTFDEAVATLREMRENALYGEVVIQAILFGIKYREKLKCMDLAELSRQVGSSPETCKVELEYGMKLAQYVNLRQD